MLAVLVAGVVPATCAVITSVADARFAMLPTVQRPVPGLYVPCDGVAVVNVSPAGSRSLSVTFVAPDGPAFVTVTVNVIVEPMIGAALLTVFATPRSACCAAEVALAVLLVVSGSN